MIWKFEKDVKDKRHVNSMKYHYYPSDSVRLVWEVWKQLKKQAQGTNKVVEWVVEDSNVYDWPCFLFADVMTVLTVDFEMAFWGRALRIKTNNTINVCFFLILIQLCDSRKAIRVISVFSVKFNVDFTRQAVNFSIILLSLKKRYTGKREKCKNWNKCPFLSGMILSLNLSKCCQTISGMNPQRKALRNMTLTRDELTSKRMGMTSLTPVSNEVHSLLRMACLKICKILVGISSVIPLNMDHIKKNEQTEKGKWTKKEQPLAI